MLRTVISVDQFHLLLKHVFDSFPKEASGLILKQEFRTNMILSVVCTSNKENNPFMFRIKESTIESVSNSIEKSGKKICGCFHSHIIGRAKPSIYDHLAKKKPGDLWLIYSIKFSELKLFKWNGNTFDKVRFRISWQQYL